MRTGSIAALGVALALTSLAGPGWTHGGGGGGGGHGGGHYVVVVGGGGVAVPLFRGQATMVALEVVDTPPSAMEADIRRGDVIAVHTLRAADAIVLLEPVKGRRRTIPAGVALARMIFASPLQHATVWCDIRPTHRPLFPQEHDCFQDVNNAGHLDRLWEGDSQSHFLGFWRSGVDAYGDAMARPVAYRAAKPQERPAALLGYRFCDGDGVTGPPRFALVVALPDDAGAWPAAGDCRFGVWTDPADKSKVTMDGLTLTVAAAGAETLHVKAVGRIPPETLGPLEHDQPVRSLADTPSPELAAAQRAASLKTPMLVSDGRPASVTWGAVETGQVFLTAPVKHAITGTLMNRIKPAAGLFWPPGTVVEVGQPVFGVPEPALPGDGMVWCAPQLKTGGWESACLMPMQAGYEWLGKRTPAMGPSAASLEFGAGVNAATSAPSVRPGPIVTPPMKITLRLAEVRARSSKDATPIYHIDVDLDWGEGPQVMNRVAYDLPASGRRLVVLGTAMNLKPGASPTGLVVEAAAPPALRIFPVSPPPRPAAAAVASLGW